MIDDFVKVHRLCIALHSAGVGQRAAESFCEAAGK